MKSRNFQLKGPAPQAEGQPRPKPPPGQRQRIVPPRRPANLRRGGGRRDKPGWTEQKRKSNRRRFDQLRPFIVTGVTVICPSRANPAQLKAIGDCCQNFCKEKGLAARAVWEGPLPHFHIALACPHSAELERKWRMRLEARWLAVFGLPMPGKTFLWQPNVAGQQIASYLSKTYDKKGRRVKGRPAWLTFPPAWETGFRSLILAQASPAACPGPARPARQLRQIQSHPKHPHYTHYLQNNVFGLPEHETGPPQLTPCHP